MNTSQGQGSYPVTYLLHKQIFPCAAYIVTTLLALVFFSGCQKLYTAKQCRELWPAPKTTEESKAMSDMQIALDKSKIQLDRERDLNRLKVMLISSAVVCFVGTLICVALKQTLFATLFAMAAVGLAGGSAYISAEIMYAKWVALGGGVIVLIAIGYIVILIGSILRKQVLTVETVKTALPEDKKAELFGDGGTVKALQGNWITSAINKLRGK